MLTGASPVTLIAIATSSGTFAKTISLTPASCAASTVNTCGSAVPEPVKGTRLPDTTPAAVAGHPAIVADASATTAPYPAHSPRAAAPMPCVTGASAPGVVPAVESDPPPVTAAPTFTAPPVGSVEPTVTLVPGPISRPPPTASITAPSGGVICEPAPTVPMLKFPGPSIVASPATTSSPSDSAALAVAW